MGCEREQTVATKPGPETDNQETDIPLAEHENYVGGDTCGACHEAESRAWQGSHHDLAMQAADESTVLGDFDNTEFSHSDIETRFFQKDGEYFVNTLDENGSRLDFPVRYTFGVYPLQQYLLEMPDGKIQAFGIAWDSRAMGKGGQRWFHVYGDELIPPNDVLYWTHMSQNWDSMCAECHSTALVKKYDLASDTFDTRWTDIDVSCEACHGPGKGHLRWADNPDESPEKGLAVQFHERRNVSWLTDDESGFPVRSEPRMSDVEMTVCAPCHSRRARIGSHVQPPSEMLNVYLPALLDPPLYHADGRILDEVYVYGSFLQSRMHQKGVSCSDCHNPHSLELRAPGNAVCAQCHVVENLSSAIADHHQSSSPDCIGCHMPTTDYMQIDARNDHSIRIPRSSPGEVSVTSHWSERLAATAEGSANKQDIVLSLVTDASVPALVRATAAQRLYSQGNSDAGAAISGLLMSDNALLRWAGMESLRMVDPRVQREISARMLDDPVKAVRLSAVSILAQFGLSGLPADIQPLMSRNMQEYVDAQLVNSERPEAHINLGNLYRNIGRSSDSEDAYKTAITLNPVFVPGYVNLADLYRARNRDADGEILLRDAIDRQPQQPALHHVLGLLLIRQGKIDSAFGELRTAAELDGSEPAYVIGYALALDAQGRTGEAIEVLDGARAATADDPSVVATLVNLHQRSGNYEAARQLREKSVSDPDIPEN